MDKNDPGTEKKTSTLTPQAIDILLVIHTLGDFSYETNYSLQYIGNYDTGICPTVPDSGRAYVRDSFCDGGICPGQLMSISHHKERGTSVNIFLGPSTRAHIL